MQRLRKYLFTALLPLLFLHCSDSVGPADDLSTFLFAEGHPSEAGLDEAMLNDLAVRTEIGEFGEIYSVLIVRNDKLVFEKYFRGFSRSTLHDCYSVTKSITSALVGTALEQKLIRSLDDYVIDYFKQYENIQYLDSRKNAITLRHILTMTSGLKWDESSYIYFDPRNDAYQMARSSDWIKFVLDREMDSSPGTKFTYNSGCTLLLSGVISSTAHNSVEKFALEHLFPYLKINDYEWETIPNELTNTGWGLKLRPIDMAAFGYLYLKNGNIGGKQIIPEEWIKISTAKQINLKYGYHYGYQWWQFSNSSSIGAALKINDLYFAWGFGGQFIFVIPHLNMIIIMTGANYIQDDLAFTMLKEYIFPSIKD